MQRHAFKNRSFYYFCSPAFYTHCMIRTLPLRCCLAAIVLMAGCGHDDKPENGVKVVHFEGTDLVKQSIAYKNGRRNGAFKEFYRNGILKTKQVYVNDTLDDTSFFYHPNGKLKSIHTYKNKQKHGCWKEYNKSGKLYSEICLKDGLLDSTSTVYTYNSGRLLTRIAYRNGARHGHEERFYSNGKPCSSCWYDNGTACFGTEEWNDDGTKINNDFSIMVAEQNQVMIKGVLAYKVKLERPAPGDKVYQVLTPNEGRKPGQLYPLKRDGDGFLLEFNISKNNFVMEKVTLAAYRKTGKGNTIIKTTTFNVSANNF